MLFKQFIAKTEVDSDERTVTGIISTSTVDRHKDVMLPKGGDFEKYLKNPVVLWAHEYHDTPVAKTLWLKRNKNEIRAKMRFAEETISPRAEEIYQFYKQGYLNAFSIGYLPHDSHAPTPEEIKKQPDWAKAKNIIDKWELLEFSAVPVPANQDALVTAVKTKELKISSEMAGELNLDLSVEDDEEYFTTNSIYDIGLKPYPNEHACRINNPDKYSKFRRVKCAQKHDGKCIDVIYGILSEGKSEIQALRFPTKIWTATAAKSLCKARNGTFEAAGESSADKVEVKTVKKRIGKVKQKIYEVYNVDNINIEITKQIYKKFGKVYL